MAANTPLEHPWGWHGSKAGRVGATGKLEGDNTAKEKHPGAFGWGLVEVPQWGQQLLLSRGGLGHLKGLKGAGAGKSIGINQC